MEYSALRNVFGSSASLAELSGDTLPTERPKSGYSRFGLNEHPPAHQMHTKTRRNSLPPRPDELKSRRRFPSWQFPLVFVAFGAVQALLIDFHSPFFLRQGSPSAQTVASMLVFVVVSVSAGFAIPHTDKNHSSRPDRLWHTSPTILQGASFAATNSGSESDGSARRRRPSSIAGRPRPNSFSGRPASVAGPASDDSPYSSFQSIVRGYGILLGLLYLSEQLPGDAGKAWLLIVPTVWYVADGTANGFAISAAVAVVSAVLSYCLLPGMQPAVPEHAHTLSLTLYSLAGTATTYFATSIMAGNLGRWLR